MSARVSDEAVGAMVAALHDVLPFVIPAEEIGNVAVQLSTSLAEQLGGVIVDPAVVGLTHAYVLGNTGDVPARELYFGDEVGDPLVQWLTENGWAEYTEVE